MNAFNSIFKGKLTRKQFLIRWLMGFVLVVASFVFILTSYNNEESIAGLLLLLVIIIFWLYAISLYIRRLHDLGNSGWWTFLVLVPFVNVGLFIYLLFFPSVKKK